VEQQSPQAEVGGLVMKASLIALGLIWTALVIDVNGQNLTGRSKAEPFDLSRIDARAVDQFYQVHCRSE
jgi:hypothetical protein